jgi:MFS superfamily sulfate permease-like transporter
VLGRVDGIRGYHDITRYPEARLVPGLVLFRLDAPLFFANAELFQQRVLVALASSPTPVRRIIVAAEPVTSVDVTELARPARLASAVNAARSSALIAATSVRVPIGATIAPAEIGLRRAAAALTGQLASPVYARRRSRPLRRLGAPGAPHVG